MSEKEITKSTEKDAKSKEKEDKKQVEKKKKEDKKAADEKKKYDNKSLRKSKGAKDKEPELPPMPQDDELTKMFLQLLVSWTPIILLNTISE